MELLQRIKDIYEDADKNWNHGYDLLKYLDKNNDLQESRTDYSTVISYAMDTVRMLDDIKSIIEKEESKKKLSDESWRYKNIFDHSQYPQSFECPEGYQFKDENGNVINATKIALEKKKKEYPKTYEECCKVMNYCCNSVATKTTHKEGLIRKFQFLLLYRDAYWKIAGEEMGLGKPWEPSETKLVYPITRYGTQICTHEEEFGMQRTFEFPTEEMRDAFKGNFDKDLEFCKELL